MALALWHVQFRSARNNSFGTDADLLIEGSSTDDNHEGSSMRGFHKTEGGVEFERNRCSWAYLGKLLGMPSHALGKHFWRQEFLSEQVEPIEATSTG